MNVKNFISILLAGTLSASILTGCSKTIIEHQFHTNTEYVTEYITKTEYITVPEIIEVEVTAAEKIERIEELLSNHEINLYISLNTFMPTPEDILAPTLDISVTDIDSEKFSSWIDTTEPWGSSFAIYSEYAYDYENFNLHEYVINWLELLDKFYNAFSALTEEQWETLQSKCQTPNRLAIGGELISGEQYHVECFLQIVTMS